MQVDRHADRRLEAADELVRVHRREQPGHVLDAEGVGAEILQASGQIDEPVNAVHRARGVADRGLHVLVRAADGGDGGFHVADVVQGVEDAENVHAVGGSPLDEGVHHVVGIVAIAHQILPPQQHLEPRIGHDALDRAQAFPGVLLEESQAGVEGGSAPDLQRPEADLVEAVGDLQHVLGPHARSQQGLVPVAQRHVRQKHLLGGRGLEFERLGPHRLGRLDDRASRPGRRSRATRSG